MRFHRLGQLPRQYLLRTDGAAAAELAMFLALFIPLVLNAADIGAYAFQRMQVISAAHAGAQAAWANCTSKPGASETLAAHCPNLSGAVTGAIQSSSLGTAVTLTNTLAADAGYYCPDAAGNNLTVATSTTTCADTNKSAGYYVKVAVTYSFHPIFMGATIASLFPAQIAPSAWTRIE